MSKYKDGPLACDERIYLERAIASIILFIRGGWYGREPFDGKSSIYFEEPKDPLGQLSVTISRFGEREPAKRIDLSLLAGMSAREQACLMAPSIMALLVAGGDLQVLHEPNPGPGEFEPLLEGSKTVVYEITVIPRERKDR